jgi:hypothetical protein
MGRFLFSCAIANAASFLMFGSPRRVPSPAAFQVLQEAPSAARRELVVE